jgi:8-oxo-dGTP pyrophosphatase MutT (NUDIX family)
LVEFLRKVQVYVYRKRGRGFQFLLLKRTKTLGGYWQGITGSVEKNESYKEAALREAKEEVNLKNFQRITGPVYFQKFKKNKKFFKEAVYGIYVKTFPLQLSGEHQTYRWAKYKTALKLLSWPENQKGLAKLKAKLKE